MLGLRGFAVFSFSPQRHFGHSVVFRPLGDFDFLHERASRRPKVRREGTHLGILHSPKSLMLRLTYRTAV